MATKQIILFDAASTSPLSQIVCIGADACIQVQAFNLSPAEALNIDAVAMEPGTIAVEAGGSCCLAPTNAGPSILATGAFAPCGSQLQIIATRNMRVIRTPGCYRFNLTPSAVGTAIVIGTIMDDVDSCNAAASACCCEPEASNESPAWTGTSANICLTITPGGTLGHNPVFDVDPCCLLQQIVAVQAPLPADEIIFMSGGECFRTPISAVAAAETPWTGTSNNPNLTITPGGTAGHAPVFNYNLCADLDTFVAGVLAVGDTVPVLTTGGACKQVLATAFAGVTSFPLLAPNGTCPAPSYSFTASPDSGMFYNPSGAGSVVIADDNCVDAISIGGAVSITTNSVTRHTYTSAGEWNVGGAVGTSGQVLTSNGVGVAPTWQSPTGTTFPLLAPSGTCAAPTYSFSASPDSGMFYSAVGAGSVVIGDDNCVDSVGVGGGVAVTTNSVLRHTYTSTGEWNVGGSVGTSGQVLTSNGVGVAPTWQSPAAVSFPLLAPNGSCAAPSYSFAASPDSGMFYNPAGAGSVVIGDDNCVDSIVVGASISVTTNSVLRHTYTNTGEWNIGGSVGSAGQAVVSNGPGVPPTWQTPTAVAVVPINDVQNATGSATRAHGTNSIVWGWSGIPASSGPVFTISESASGNGAVLMEVISNTVGGNFAIPFRASWPNGGLFQTGGGAVSGCIWRGSGGGIGQEITIDSGSNNAGNGGGLNLRAGSSLTNTGGGVNILAGSGIQGSTSSMTGGASLGSATVGGDAFIGGGANTHVAGIRGGSVDIRGGGASNLPTLQQGNIYLNAQLLTAIGPTATSGFVYLPMTSAAPTGVPLMVAPTGLPMILRVSGATVVMHIYDGTAWRSATFS